MSQTSTHIPRKTSRILSFGRSVTRRLLRSGLTYLLAIAALFTALWAIYQWTTVPIMLVVDGEAIPFRTHQATVDAFLQEIGLQVELLDVVIPPRDAPLTGGETVTIRRARPFVVEADGRVLRLHSHAKRADILLYEAGIDLDPHDGILIDGNPVPTNAPVLPQPNEPTDESHLTTSGQSSKRIPSRSASLRVSVRRAIPLHIQDDTLAGKIYTTAPTVGEALLEQGIVLYLGDQVRPNLGTRLSAGLHVYIRRSMPVEILVDNRRIRTRTQASTVGELLTQVGVALLGKDLVSPSDATPIEEDITVKITRIREEIVEEEELIPVETTMQADPDLEIDQQRVQQAGEEGLTKRRFRVYYEDGQEIARVLEDEWLDREPQAKIINYGTKIVIRQLETPDGPIEYWRRVRVLATSYTAAESQEPDDPYYGLTYLGWKMRAGIIAVDPRVISLRTEMYVHGYGQGIAADTGGAIKGRRIDLGYEDDELVLWYNWVDAYLLTPPPPPDQIRWVLPNWPREK